MLHKPQFDCNKIGDFYDCGCEGEPDGETEDSDLKDGNKSTGYVNKVAKDENFPVEIAKEPTTRG